jgi:cyclopropane fatty-acyl-phospholipid synthase-like methyltransferase
MSKDIPLSSAEALPGGQRFDKDYAYGAYTSEYFNGLLRKRKKLSQKWRYKWLDRCLDAKAGDKIVDLGCGAGLVARHFLERGAAVHGVDLADEGVRTATELNKEFPLASFKVCDASKCDHLASGTFDKACSVDVIEHCGHDVMLDIFAEAHRLLKTGGLYFIYTPNPRHWIERCKDWGFILKQDPTHTGLRLVKTILEGLEQKGFEIVENLKPASMIPVLNWFERAWSYLPGVGQLGVYRIAVLARKK